MTPTSPILPNPQRSDRGRKLAGVLKASLVVVVGVGGAFALGYAVKAHPAEAREIVVQPPKGAPASFADLIEKVSPAVVSIEVKGKAPKAHAGPDAVPDDQEDDNGDEGGLDGLPPDAQELFRRFGLPPGAQRPAPRPTRVAGSGFFISEDGLLVTNNHVVENAAEITIKLSDDRQIKAELVGADVKTDLAVLRAKERGPFPYVAFEHSEKPRVGDWVIAIGNPFDLGATATAGIVSAVARDTNDQYVDFLQIDAPINRGNSGGPTFDLYGHVIGVNSQILSPTGGSVGIGFAIPAETADKIVSQLISKGRVQRGWLGVTIGSVSDNIAAASGLSEAKGALIAQVNDDSPAAKAGFKIGDIVLKIDGSAVKDSSDLSRRVADLTAHSTHEFDILRDGQRKIVKAVIGERPSEAVLAVNNGRPGATPENDSEIGKAADTLWGLKVAPLSARDRRRLNLESADKGLVIVNVDSDSPLAEEGLVPGLAITEANHRPIASAADLERAASEARAKGLKAVLLRIQTKDGPAFIGARLDKDTQ